MVYIGFYFPLEFIRLYVPNTLLCQKEISTGIIKIISDWIKLYINNYFISYDGYKQLTVIANYININIRMSFSWLSMTDQT